MKKENITIDYDEEADVLYISFGKPREAITEELDNLAIRLDEKTKEVVGITVIDFLRNFRKKHSPIEISV